MASGPQEQPSLLHMERIAQYVSLSPAALATPLPALCATIFSPLLLSYFPPTKGIVLAYEDVQLSTSPPPHKLLASERPLNSHAQHDHDDHRHQDHDHDHDTSNSDSDSDSDASDSNNRSVAQPLLLRHIDEYAAPFLWASATFLVFRPARGALLTARLTHQAQSHITLSYLNMFPVSVLAADLPASWTWKVGAPGEAACWVIGGSRREEVQGGREVQVKIKDFDGRLDGKGRGKGFLKIEGVVLEES